jgi:hypothetical protein
MTKPLSSSFTSPLTFTLAALFSGQLRRPAHIYQYSQEQGGKARRNRRIGFVRYDVVDDDI